jgi:glutamine synthetase
MSLAPDRAAWGRDNRGAMLRVLGGPGDSASRIENRVGEPSANPYLYIASQAYAGLSGITQEMRAPPSADEPYQAEAVKLPTSLQDALQAMRADSLIRECFGEDFIGYYCHIKEAELERFNLEVTEWEAREYLDMF